jgi:WD40 repeat protein
VSHPSRLLPASLLLVLAPSLFAEPARESLPCLGDTRLRHDGWVTGVAFAPDGKTLASAGHDKLVRLWDPATGRILQSLREESAEVAAFSHDGKVLATASLNGVVSLWSVETPAGKQTPESLPP